jgi:hypothetical protein
MLSPAWPSSHAASGLSACCPRAVGECLAVWNMCSWGAASELCAAEALAYVENNTNDPWLTQPVPQLGGMLLQGTRQTDLSFIDTCWPTFNPSMAVLPASTLSLLQSLHPSSRYVASFRQILSQCERVPGDQHCPNLETGTLFVIMDADLGVLGRSCSCKSH